MIKMIIYKAEIKKNWLFETSPKNYMSIKKEYNELDLFK